MLTGQDSIRTPPATSASAPGARASAERRFAAARILLTFVTTRGDETYVAEFAALDPVSILFLGGFFSSGRPHIGAGACSSGPLFETAMI